MLLYNNRFPVLFALLAVGSCAISAKADIVVIGQDPSALQGNFGNPGTTATVGYTIDLTDNGTHLNVLLVSTGPQALLFSNLYHGIESGLRIRPELRCVRPRCVRQLQHCRPGHHGYLHIEQRHIDGRYLDPQHILPKRPHRSRRSAFHAHGERRIGLAASIAELRLFGGGRQR
jgi:hypothetical protein